MAREVPEIDRLIELGLTLYGQGNLDGALLEWEKALAIDPDNAQANSYVDYVRANYELLTNDINGETTKEGAPFGIADDEPEYQIEIQPGEIKATNAEAAAPEYMDPLDEGWFFDDETQDSRAYPGPPSIGLDGRPSQEMTLDADEPPPVPAPPVLPETEPAPRAKRASEVGMEFDDATREYDKRKHTQPAPEEFGHDVTPGFGHPNDFQTPPGFGTQITGIKQRDLGFVQPTAAAEPPPKTTELGFPVTDRPRTPAPPSQPANSMSELTLDPRHAASEPPDRPTTQRLPMQASALDDMDLISSLPSPRPAPQVPKIDLDTPQSGSSPGHTTRDFPHETRAPASPSAKTMELPPPTTLPSFGSAQTVDFETKTQERSRYDRQPDPVVSAPTRDLGLREQARPETATGRDGTRADVMLQFDPIDARATEIIEDVDEAAPRDEEREDKTRRRITTLFEKAAQWSVEGDLERAVAAVDLALSEDPNSALAQKLIHRNRETIMTVFQAYLGPLDRTPQLARPLHELANAPISPRAAFLLSRIDNLITIDEILDVCGMPRLEAYRYLCQLFLRGVLR